MKIIIVTCIKVSLLLIFAKQWIIGIKIIYNQKKNSSQLYQQNLNKHFQYIIQMQSQNSQQFLEPTIENDSNLLQSVVLSDERPIGTASRSQISSTFDQQPVGGSKKFQFSQFPQDGQQPKPAKKVVKTLKPKKPANKKLQQPEPSQNSEPAQYTKQSKENQKNFNTTTIIPLDERPINTQKPVAIDQVPIGKKSTFDEAPIGGGKSNFMMSEFPEGEQVAGQTTETVYPMAQKLKSKAVKLRLSGMQDLLALVNDDPSSPDLAQIQISKLMKQSNPACLQKILQCFKAWIQKEKNWDDQQIQAAIQNGYINGKLNTKKLTVELVDIMYEQKGDLMQRTILTGLKGKVAKSIQGYITIATELLAIYGIKKMKFLKPYIPEVVRILNTEKNPAVKTEGMNLLKEAYKWMSKDAVFPFLQNLKENFQKELQVFWESYDKNAIMTAPKDIQESLGDNGVKGAKKKLDAYEISDAQDIFKKFNQKWSQSVLKAQKWNEKTRLMQQLITASTVPKIAPTDFRHIQQMIKRLINDNNAQVVMYSLRILGALSKGMRKPFAPFVKSLFSNVIAKFRDKKTQMIDETYNTLNDFQYVISIQDVLDDIKEGLSDKAPNMKVNLIKWISKFVEKRIDDKGELSDKTIDGLRALFPIFEKLIQDGTAEVRNCMVENIAKMKLMIGDNFFDKIQNKMNKNQASKILQVKDNIKVNLPTSKQKQNEKDLSKSQVSVNGNGKDSKSRMSRTINQSAKIFVQEEEPKRAFTEIGGKVDLSGQIQNLLPKMNDQKYWEKRKQGAQTLISLINEYGQKISLGNSVHDLLSTLRVRINDPNKQLIKVFINLTGLVFGILNERQLKANAKNFICALAEGLSDRSEQNRKQMTATLNKIGEASGKQLLLSTLAQYLQGNSEGRIEVINVLMMNEDQFSKSNIQNYPKGIINCLCDKNKDIRKAAETLLQRVIQITGFTVFRNLAKEQKPAVTKDINSILDKLEKGNNLNSSALMPNGVSHIRNSDQWGAPPIGSARKKSLSKINKSFEAKQNAIEVEVLADLNESKGKARHSYVQGDDFFAPLRVLTNERIQRQEQDERIPWRTEDIKQVQEEELRNHIQTLIKADVSNKMLSFDYRKVLVSVLQIVKICKELNHQGSIREIYDLIFKWVLIRLWGGNSSLLTIVEVIPPVMSILEKKKIYLNDNDIQIVIGIIREYFIGAFLNESKVTENLHTITKCLIELSSGDRVLRKMLRQFTLEIGGIHRHITKEANVYYREGIARLIKNHMMEYMGNQESLIQTSRIKDLKNDKQFVEILYRKFHQNVLNEYGFKHPSQMENQKLVQKPVNRVETMHHPPQPQNNKMQTSSHKNIPSSSKIQSLESSNVQERDQSSRANNKNSFSNSRTLIQKKQEPQQMPVDFDLSAYPAPHPSSPLGKNIAKLLPPNQQTINFFNALFMQNGQKISNQLITYAKIIFGSILRSVINMLDRRSEYAPEKIVNQINLLQQAIKCKNIIKNAGQLLYYVTNFALSQLVYQDENKSLIYEDLRKRGIDYKIENFIKVINGVMLRILQNAAQQDTTNILLDLLIKNSRTQFFSQKTVYLIIKCISRISTQFANECRPEHVKQYLIRVNQYIAIINLELPLEQFTLPAEKPKPQENLLKAIKSTLQEIIKLYKNGIWALYDRAMNQARYPDNHIASFITSQGIPYPQKGRSTQNDQIKKINQLLSKNKTFPSGIEKLKFYVSCNPDFNPVQYFTSLNYDHKFIQMVMSALQSGSQQSNNNIRQNNANFASTYGYRKTPTKAERQERSANRHEMPSSEGNIQDKIKKLKMKFQQLQPKEQPQTQLSSQRNTNEQRNEERAIQIKRRIDQMKNKMTGNYQRQPR